MTKSLPSPITRMSQAMIVLGVCAALIVAFVNLRDKPFIQLIEGQLLDWRFILRGPILADSNIELVLVDDSETTSGEGAAISTAALIRGIKALSAQNARAIVLDPRLVKMSAPNATDAGSTVTAELAQVLGKAKNVIVPYVFSMSPSAGGRVALPAAIQRTAYSVFRTRDTASVKRPPEAGGYIAPNAGVLAAGLPGHVTYTRQHTRSRQFAYPVIGYGGAYFPSLAMEAFRQSVDMNTADIEVNFGAGLSIGSLYLPTDNLMRLAVNYHGPGGTYTQSNFTDLIDGKLPSNSFENKLVLVGLAASTAAGAFVTPYDSAMSEVEFLANVIDNIVRMNPLIRSQQIIVLDILLLALIGLFFALVAVAKKNWMVWTLGGLATAVILAGNMQAFLLFNLWMGLTFPLMAMILCTVVLVVTKRVSQRRRIALEAALLAEETQFDAPWTFERIARARKKAEVKPENAEAESPDEPSPEEEVLTLTPMEEKGAATPQLETLTVIPRKETEEKTPEEKELQSPTVPEQARAPDRATPEKRVSAYKPKTSGPSLLPVPPSDAAKASAPMEKNEQVPPAVAQKSKKPASLIPVMEPSARREKTSFDGTSKELTGGGARQNGEFDVAVLYINMSGFRKMARGLGPMRASEFIHAIYQLIEKTVVRHKGFLEQFGDENVMALFGLPEGSPKDAENCLRSARELSAALSEWGARQGFPAEKSADFCICANYGPVRIHAKGESDETEVSVSGHAIGLASRLEKAVAAKGAGVIASEKLMAKVRETDTDGELKNGFKEQPMQDIPGSAEQVGLWRAEHQTS
ncbi:MAG: adenylate/guanylate cyclase domain-containing protein [Sneathiella sp.]